MMALKVSKRNKKPGDKIYYSITEVGKMTDLKPHILRYWETEFPFLRPKRNRAGNRAYRKKDIDMILQIKHLLYDEGYTIEGAKLKIRAMRKAESEREETISEVETISAEKLQFIRELLKEILQFLLELKK